MSRTCPACAGVLGPAAQWCGLCFADLREPVPVPVPAVEAVAVEAVVLEPAPRLDPRDLEPVGPPAVVVLPLVDPPAPAGATEPGWPCSVCSSVVPYESEACPVCGAGFLSALTGSGVPRLPVVGTSRAGGHRGAWVLAAVFFGAVALLMMTALALAARTTG